MIKRVISKKLNATRIDQIVQSINAFLYREWMKPSKLIKRVEVFINVKR